MTYTRHKSGITPGPGDALVIVDVQNDFLPGGALAVPRGDEVVSALNRYIRGFQSKALPIYATRDWHPDNHCSFKQQGGPWPPHCIAGTRGADFARALDLPKKTVIIPKATTQDKDAYSGFEGTDLGEHLRTQNIKRIFVGGLATDYCVLDTVKDALKLGFTVMLLKDAIRAVDVTPGDGEKAQQEMQRLGAQAISLEMLAA